MAASEEHSRGASEAASGEGSHGSECVEWCPICRTMDVLRSSTTPEMREGWEDIQREALLTLRTLAEHYVQRVGEQRAGGGGAREAAPRSATPVEELPIE
jgi:hypothetical protein